MMMASQLQLYWSLCGTCQVQQAQVLESGCISLCVVAGCGVLRMCPRQQQNFQHSACNSCCLLLLLLLPAAAAALSR